MPKASDFELVEAPLPEPGEGEVLVQNLYTSVDPYMRGGMRSAELGKPLEGRCAGQIVQSNSDQFQVGDYVTGMLGWRDHYVAPAASVTAVDTTIAPLQSFLGAGRYARTYCLLRFSGDRVNRKRGKRFLCLQRRARSVQLCVRSLQSKGAASLRVLVPIRRVAWLLETAGVDAAFNYKNVDDLEAELRKHCPDGLDIYFENVGGRHLQAATRSDEYARTYPTVWYDLPI